MGRCVCLDDWADMENYSVLYWLCTYLGLQWLRCIGYIGTYITLHWLGNLWHTIRIHTKQIRIHREIQGRFTPSSRDESSDMCLPRPCMVADDWNIYNRCVCKVPDDWVWWPLTRNRVEGFLCPFRRHSLFI